MVKDRSEYFRKRRQSPEYKEYMRKAQQKWRDENPEASRALSKRNRDKHKEHFNKVAGKRLKKRRDELDDYYVRHLLWKSMGRLVDIWDIPQDLIDLHRAKILTNRTLKLKQNGSNNFNHMLAGYAKSTQRKPSRATNGQKKTVNRKRSK